MVLHSTGDIVGGQHTAASGFRFAERGTDRRPVAWRTLDAFFGMPVYPSGCPFVRIWYRSSAYGMGTGQGREFSVRSSAREERFGCAKLAPLSAIFPLGKVVESGLGVRR